DVVAYAALLGTTQELGGGLCRVPVAAPRFLDRVPDLDRVRALIRVHARRAVVTGVPDHLSVEHDRVRAPLAEALVLLHLAQAEREETHAALMREAVGQLHVERIRRPLAVALEEGLEELRRHRSELDQSQEVSR